MKQIVRGAIATRAVGPVKKKGDGVGATSKYAIATKNHENGNSKRRQGEPVGNASASC
jgi:hypothetical protein